MCARKVKRKCIKVYICFTLCLHIHTRNLCKWAYLSECVPDNLMYSNNLFTINTGLKQEHYRFYSHSLFYLYNCFISALTVYLHLQLYPDLRLHPARSFTPFSHQHLLYNYVWLQLYPVYHLHLLYIYTMLIVLHLFYIYTFYSYTRLQLCIVLHLHLFYTQTRLQIHPDLHLHLLYNYILFTVELLFYIYTCFRPRPV